MGSRVVHLAVFRGYLDVVSFLVEVGANPNQLLTETGKTVKTVLHLAAQGGHVDRPPRVDAVALRGRERRS